jgi:hypothetical protein
MISSTQRPLLTQQTQSTNIHALSGIRNRDASIRAASELRPTLHGYRDRLLLKYVRSISMRERCLDIGSVLYMHESVSNLDLELKHLDLLLLTKDFLTTKVVMSGLNKMDRDILLFISNCK